MSLDFDHGATDSRFFGVHNPAVIDFLEGRVSLPRSERHLLLQPEIRDKREAFWTAVHLMRQDQPLFLLVGSLASSAMVLDLAIRGIWKLVEFL